MLAAAERGELALGGCCLDLTSPAWQCRKCRQRYGKYFDDASEESSTPQWEGWIVLDAPEFTLWLVRSKTYDSQSIEPFHGGPLNDPYRQPVHGVFLTEAEAHQHAPGLLTSRGRVLSHINNPGLYPEPIAWLVTFIILMQSTGEGELHVEPTFGGECLWNDDRDVMAIFQTHAEAEAFAASR